MCGIFGAVQKNTSSNTQNEVSNVVNKLFKLSETRGKEASGITFLSNLNTDINILKSLEPASKLVKTKEYKSTFKNFLSPSTKAGTFAAMGHTRLVTNGSQVDQKNNQPVVSGDCVTIHNGIIVNIDDVWAKFSSLKRNTDVDTEIIPTLVNHFISEGNPVKESVIKTFAEIKGTASVALTFKSMNILVIATNNGSLYTANSDDATYFASERHTLLKLLESNAITDKSQFKIEAVLANTGLIIDLDNNKKFEFSLTESDSNDITLSQSTSKEIKVKALTPSNNQTHSVFDIKKVTVNQKLESYAKRMEQKVDELKRCTKCVLPETIPFIQFNSEGVCNFCTDHKNFELYGEDKLVTLLDKYRKPGKDRDCVVALSGGRDSCYGLHKIVKDYGMKPVTYTYDWGVVADLARRNVSRMCSELGIENIIISADIKWKRENINKNVKAWLNKPHLGMIPLFMAGDKQFIWYASQIRKQEGIDLEIFSFNQFEKSQFKEEYTGVQMWRPGADADKMGEDLAFLNRLKLGLFYSKEFLTNPGYINRSLIDTMKGYWYFYYAAKDFCPLFHYIPWVEKECDDVLINQYGWETATDTDSTWRIGDGTASFYNYIYYTCGGFTEFDTFRSNQVREGRLTREEALELVKRDNLPRWDSLKWYCDIIGLDFESTVQRVNEMPKTTPKLNCII